MILYLYNYLPLSITSSLLDYNLSAIRSRNISGKRLLWTFPSEIMNVPWSSELFMFIWCATLSVKMYVFCSESDSASAATKMLLMEATRVWIIIPEKLPAIRAEKCVKRRINCFSPKNYSLLWNILNWMDKETPDHYLLALRTELFSSL